MNKVTFGIPAVVHKPPQRGSLWTSRTGHIFILSETSGNKYAAISLIDGNRWYNSCDRIEDAVLNLSPFMGTMVHIQPGSHEN